MRTFPRARIDALTNGIFAFAMTLLVLELRLPDQPVRDGAALIADLLALGQKYLAYVISFFVLAAHWRSNIELRQIETVSAHALGWSIVLSVFRHQHSILLGRGRSARRPAARGLALRRQPDRDLRAFAAPARSGDHAEHRQHARLGHFRIVFAMGTAILSVLVSLVVPQQAMYVYLLNLLAGPIASRWYGREAQMPAQP